MKISTILTVLTLVVVISAIGGCTHRIGDFTAMSTKNIYCDHVDITKLKQHKEIEGEDVRFLGIGANIEDAADRAMLKADGNIIIDAAVYSVYGPFFGGYKIKGTVVAVPYKK